MQKAMSQEIPYPQSYRSLLKHQAPIPSELHIHELSCPNQTTISLCDLVYFHMLLKDLESTFWSFSTVSHHYNLSLFTLVQSKNLLADNGSHSAVKWISKEIHKASMQTEELRVCISREHPQAHGRGPTKEQQKAETDPPDCQHPFLLLFLSLQRNFFLLYDTYLSVPKGHISQRK